MPTGTVSTFDDATGVGTVTVDGADGVDGSHFFHCTAIADGSRTIAVGARVSFVVVAGRRGQWEAHDIRPAAPIA